MICGQRCIYSVNNLLSIESYSFILAFNSYWAPGKNKRAQKILPSQVYTGDLTGLTKESHTRSQTISICRWWPAGALVADRGWGQRGWSWCWQVRASQTTRRQAQGRTFQSGGTALRERGKHSGRVNLSGKGSERKKRHRS